MRDERRRRQAYLDLCHERNIDSRTAERALDNARFDIKVGRALGRDPYRLAWRRLAEQVDATPGTLGSDVRYPTPLSAH